MKVNFFLKWAKIGLLFLALAMLYNNCGKKFVGDDFLLEGSSKSNSGNGSSGTVAGEVDMTDLFSGDKCDQDIKLLFSNGYYKFARQNCALCHTNGPGKGRFASTNFGNAFADFFQVGYSKPSDNATNGHQSNPNSGPQNIQTINELRLEWQQGMQNFNLCKGITTDDSAQVNVKDLLTLETNEKTVPSLQYISTTNPNGTGTMEWDLSSELNRIKGTDPLPVLTGAKFSVNVAKYRTLGGESYYTFNMPRIYGNTRDVKVKTIQVKINGRLITYPTTFRYVDKGVYANESATSILSLITTGSLVSPGILSDADKISFAFELIEQTTLPDRPAVVYANFASTGTKVVNSSTGQMDVTVRLNASSSLPVTVSVSTVNETLCTPAGTGEFTNIKTCNTALAQVFCPVGNCADSVYRIGYARSIVGTTYNRYDWDYKFQNTSITFLPGETSKTISIIFSKDFRKESNRILTLEIDSILVGADRGTDYRARFAIMKTSNPVPLAGVATFSELMNPQTGILGVNCVKCHNSRDRNGGYDMTDYELMLERGVVIPNQVESKMFYRMNPSSPNYIQNAAMPIDGALPVNLRKEVENWILNGAPNN